MLLEICTKQIGVLRKTHGVQGALVLLLDDDVSADLIWDAGFFFIEIDGGQVPYRIHEIRHTHSSQYLLFLEGVDDEKSARFLTRKTVFVECASVGDKDEETNQQAGDSYLGFILLNQEGVSLGTITGYVLDVPDNPLFEIDDGNYLIPIHEELLIAVDESQKILQYIIHDGLTDL